jgi:hypothetical protein
MIHKVAAIYRAALAALDEAVTHPAQRAEMLTLAKGFAAGTGDPGSTDFLSAALSLTPLQQGEMLWRINKSQVDPIVRARVADGLARRARLLSSLPDPQASNEATQFANTGIAHIPALVSPIEAAEIVAYLKTCSKLKREGPLLRHDRADVARAPHAFRIATDARVLEIAHQHLGAPPTVMQIDAWLSEPGEGHGAEIFHRDRDDFRACKLFVYLTDVSGDSGPHIFVRTTHRPDAIIETLRTHGIDVANARKFFTGDGRHVAGHIEKLFGTDVLEVTGPAGTSFLENTYAFHRGKPAGGRSRYLFQVMYALVPYPARLESWRRTDLSALPPDSASDARAREAVRLAVADRPAS